MTLGLFPARIPTANCEPRTVNCEPKKTGPLRRFLPERPAFPVGYVFAGHPRGWLAMFRWGLCTEWIRVAPPRTNGFLRRGFRKIGPAPIFC
jgi:hypothetical protein